MLTPAQQVTAEVMGMILNGLDPSDVIEMHRENARITDAQAATLLKALTVKPDLGVGRGA